MCTLHQLGVSSDILAKAWKLDRSIVDETIDIPSGKFKRFGWDETLYVLIHDPEAAKVCFEILVDGRWLPLGKEHGSALDFAMTPAGSDLDKDLNVSLWPVLGFGASFTTDRKASVGIKAALRKACSLTDAEAVNMFDLGRLGGAHTSAGHENLTRFRTATSEFAESQKDVSQTSKRVSIIDSPLRTRSSQSNSSPKSCQRPRKGLLTKSDYGAHSLTSSVCSSLISKASLDSLDNLDQDSGMRILSQEWQSLLADKPSSWSDDFELR